eukprot:5421958-Ditylum_brightwellii.AAC.1
MATIRSLLSTLDSDGKNQWGPSMSSSSCSLKLGLRAASVLDLLPPCCLASSYHLKKDWYRGQRNRSSPNGRDRKSIAYRMTPALHTSALVPSYPCGDPTIEVILRRGAGCGSTSGSCWENGWLHPETSLIFPHVKYDSAVAPSADKLFIDLLRGERPVTGPGDMLA